jgi:hypothetical protein
MFFPLFAAAPQAGGLPWSSRSNVVQAAKPALVAARRRRFVFFEPGEASPRQQAWQPALRTCHVTSVYKIFFSYFDMDADNIVIRGWNRKLNGGHINDC